MNMDGRESCGVARTFGAVAAGTLPSEVPGGWDVRGGGRWWRQPVAVRSVTKAEADRIGAEVVAAWKAATARGPTAVTITGATGPKALLINGTYDHAPSESTPGGAPVYKRRTKMPALGCCDDCGLDLTPGPDWFHCLGSDQDFCTAHYHELDETEQPAFTAITSPDLLGDDLEVYVGDAWLFLACDNTWNVGTNEFKDARLERAVGVAFTADAVAPGTLPHEVAGGWQVTGGGMLDIDTYEPQLSMVVSSVVDGGDQEDMMKIDDGNDR